MRFPAMVMARAKAGAFEILKLKCKLPCATLELPVSKSRSRGDTRKLRVF
jgi:hypothetical protein